MFERLYYTVPRRDPVFGAAEMRRVYRYRCASQRGRAGEGREIERVCRDEGGERERERERGLTHRRCLEQQCESEREGGRERETKSTRTSESEHGRVPRASAKDLRGKRCCWRRRDTAVEA